MADLGGPDQLLQRDPVRLRDRQQQLQAGPALAGLQAATVLRADRLGLQRRGPVLSPPGTIKGVVATTASLAGEFTGAVFATGAIRMPGPHVTLGP